MEYFRARENLKTDYSGYQEASSSLRNRLNTVCQQYISKHIGFGNRNYWVYQSSLEYELGVNLEKKDISQIILKERYDYVFEAIEIFLTLAEKDAWERFRAHILPDIQRAFKLSGSVYFVNADGKIILKIDKKLAQSLEEVKKVLKENQSAFKTFFEAVGNLMARKDSPENIVKDIFVASENYLKVKTGKSNFSKAIAHLASYGTISYHQRALLDKIQVYRSDAFKVAHAGNSGKPMELDAIWFLETVTAQLKLIDRKLSQKNVKMATLK